MREVAGQRRSFMAAALGQTWPSPSSKAPTLCLSSKPQGPQVGLVGWLTWGKHSRVTRGQMGGRGRGGCESRSKGYQIGDLGKEIVMVDSEEAQTVGSEVAACWFRG